MRDEFFKEIEKKRQEALARIRLVPISCLIWGPSPNTDSPTGKCRGLLKDKLVSLGHYACYSEELYDPNLDVSNLLQQVAQA